VICGLADVGELAFGSTAFVGGGDAAAGSAPARVVASPVVNRMAVKAANADGTSAGNGWNIFMGDRGCRNEPAEFG
jgi:hypothetical protein